MAEHDIDGGDASKALEDGQRGKVEVGGKKGRYISPGTVLKDFPGILPIFCRGLPARLPSQFLDVVFHRASRGRHDGMLSQREQWEGGSV